MIKEIDFEGEPHTHTHPCNELEEITIQAPPPPPSHLVCKISREHTAKDTRHSSYTARRKSCTHSLPLYLPSSCPTPKTKYKTRPSHVVPSFPIGRRSTVKLPRAIQGSQHAKTMATGPGTPPTALPFATNLQHSTQQHQKLTWEPEKQRATRATAIVYMAHKYVDLNNSSRALVIC